MTATVTTTLRATVATTVTALCIAACGGDLASARVTIPPGASMKTAADSLKKAGVIGSPKLFRLYAKLRRSDRQIKAGTYLLKRDAGWGTVLASLRDGRGVVNTLTVPEGFRMTQTESLMVAKLALSPDSIRAAMRDSALLHRLGAPPRAKDLEGYLFPDTYFFPPGTSARVAVSAMVRRFEQRWKTEWGARLDTLSMSRHSVMTLASIVEREAKLPQERPVIAAVYWNRLRRGMRLEADPTVQYALPQYQSRLLNRHLRVKSPYNTYQNVGLPPGPIGAPGVASIEATLYPANVPYLFFVAWPDGHHEFRVRLSEHVAASREARRAWDALAKAAAASRAPAARTPAAKAPATRAPGARPGGAQAPSSSASARG